VTSEVSLDLYRCPLPTFLEDKDRLRGSVLPRNYLLYYIWVLMEMCGHYATRNH